jgi:hypothetical protein
VSPPNVSARFATAARTDFTPLAGGPSPGGEVALQRGEVGADEQGPVMEGPERAFPECAPRHLASRYQDVQPLVRLRVQTEAAEGADHQRDVRLPVHEGRRAHEGEAEVAEVVPDRSAPALPPRQGDSIPFKLGNPAFDPRF